MDASASSSDQQVKRKQERVRLLEVAHAELRCLKASRVGHVPKRMRPHQKRVHCCQGWHLHLLLRERPRDAAHRAYPDVSQLHLALMNCVAQAVYQKRGDLFFLSSKEAASRIVKGGGVRALRREFRRRPGGIPHRQRVVACLRPACMFSH